MPVLHSWIKWSTIIQGQDAHEIVCVRLAVWNIAAIIAAPINRANPNMTETAPKTAEDFFRFLDSLNISHSTKTHAPVFTVAESESLRDEIPGGHTKNLFVKDKKDQYFVLTVEENATVDLKTVHKVIGASSRVSFGRPEMLLEYLGVVPGSVTVFGAFNDTGNNVTFVLDEDLMKYDIINGHPLSNDATTSVGRDDLIRFLEATGHTPLVLKVTD